MRARAYLVSTALLGPCLCCAPFTTTPHDDGDASSADASSTTDPPTSLLDGGHGSDAAATPDATPLVPPQDALKFDGNGHTYLVVAVPGGLDWTAANERARALGGHLATITSKAEFDFVWKAVKAVPASLRPFGKGYLGPWLGGRQMDGANEPGAGWTWVTGEPWSFTAWSNGEPNNDGAAEDFLHFYSYAADLPEWGDGADTNRILGFVAEFEE